MLIYAFAPAEHRAANVRPKDRPLIFSGSRAFARARLAVIWSTAGAIRGSGSRLAIGSDLGLPEICRAGPM